MLDLGLIEAKQVLVFGGAYGNLQATRAVFMEAERLGIAPAHVFCAGDMVAYCAEPLETALFIYNWGVQCIQGNCEEALAQSREDCGCGFDEGSACDVLSQQWFRFCQNALDEKACEWFSTLPKTVVFQFGGKNFQIVHGGLSDISAFIFKSMGDNVFRDEFKLSDADCILAGHCGLPFTKIISEKIWHNTGVVGMPANDGTARTWYSLINVEDGVISFEYRALNYDAQAAFQAMKDHNLPDAYGHALLSGLWPSLDVLPEYERLQTGVSLYERVIEWTSS